MSRRRRSTGTRGARRAAVLLALVGAVLPAPAAAQDGAVERRLTARLDSLKAALAANPAARRAVRERPDTAALDTFAVGGLRVIAPVGDSARVARWVGDALAAVEARTGPIPSVPTPPTVRVDWRPIDVRYGVGDRWTRVIGETPSAVRRTLESAVTRALTDALPTRVGTWLSSHVGDPARPYEELAASRAWIVRDCFDGSSHACEVALGLRVLDPATLSDTRQRDLDAALAADPPPQDLGGGYIAFVSPEARRGFLHHLLRERPGTLERLLTGAAPPAVEPGRAPAAATILRDASGGLLGPVVGDWRADVVADRPALVPASTAGTTLLWILLFVALATRSTRWRAA